MKHKTSELTGAQLDQAVAKSLGYSFCAEIDQQVVSGDGGMAVFFSSCYAVIDRQLVRFSPSSCWRDGGPIIERKRISVMEDADERGTWHACMEFNFQGGIYGPNGEGATHLIAAMRALVDAEYGAEVELP